MFYFILLHNSLLLTLHQISPNICVATGNLGAPERNKSIGGLEPLEFAVMVVWEWLWWHYDGGKFPGKISSLPGISWCLGLDCSLFDKDLLASVVDYTQGYLQNKKICTTLPVINLLQMIYTTKRIGPGVMLFFCM